METHVGTTTFDSGIETHSVELMRDRNPAPHQIRWDRNPRSHREDSAGSKPSRPIRDRNPRMLIGIDTPPRTWWDRNPPIGTTTFDSGIDTAEGGNLNHTEVRDRTLAVTRQ